MKVLTVWQPWASLIIAGAKPYEFRGWKPPASLIGQRIVIHAAARLINRAEVQSMIRRIERGDAAEMCLHTDKAMPVLKQAIEDDGRLLGHAHLPWACGLGTAIVGEPRLGTRIAEEFGVPRANDSDRDEHANWGWPMLEIEAWPEPIPARGKQGLWNWPTPADHHL